MRSRPHFYITFEEQVSVWAEYLAKMLVKKHTEKKEVKILTLGQFLGQWDKHMDLSIFPKEHKLKGNFKNADELQTINSWICRV